MKVGVAPAIARVQAGMRDVRLVVTAGVSISGTVVDASGEAPQGGHLNFTLEDGTWIGGTRIQNDGKFELKFVPEGARGKLAGYVISGGNYTQVQHEPVVEAGAADVKIEVK